MEFLVYLSMELNKYCLSADSSLDRKTGKPILEDTFLSAISCARVLAAAMRKYGEINPSLKHSVKSSIDAAVMQLPSQYAAFVDGKQS